MDQIMIYIIAGVAAFLLMVVVLMMMRKKKVKTVVPTAEKQLEGSKYNGKEASDEELESSPSIELTNYEDGVNALVLRFDVKGATLKIDDIEPYDNDWGYVHNYNEIVGQKRHEGQQLRLFFNRRKRKTTDTKDAFVINIIYRGDNGVQWLQPIKYNSNKGVKLKKLQVLGQSDS
jgi:hypothetical protein